MSTEQDTEALAELLDATRAAHPHEVTGRGEATCQGCGANIRIQRDSEGQALYNPFIRHHHEVQANAILASDWLAGVIAQAKAEGAAEALQSAADKVMNWKFTAEFADWLRDRATALEAGGER